MFKKVNIKWLMGLFVALLALVVILLLNDSKKGSRSFKSDLTDLDTSKVTQIIITPKSKQEEVILKREDTYWKIKVDDKWYNADKRQVKNMLASLSDLKAKRLAANEKSRWKDFEVTDSLATRVEVLGGKKTLVDIYLGKFSFQQIPSRNPYQRPQNSMTTYVRLSGEKEVYSVDGMLSMSFNRAASDFRDNTIVNVNKNNLEKITLTSSSETINMVKEENNWLVDGLVADSTAAAKYINSLTRLSNSNFIDEGMIVEQQPAYSLKLEGEDIQTITIQAFEADTANGYAIESSLNPGSYFSSKKSGLFDKIFIKREKLFGEKEEIVE